MGKMGGLCATDSVSEVLHNCAWGAYDDHDGKVAVFEGHKICDIYDGVRVEPIRVIARFSLSEFEKSAESIACEYEAW
jgi:hypothetical protein